MVGSEVLKKTCFFYRILSMHRLKLSCGIIIQYLATINLLHAQIDIG